MWVCELRNPTKFYTNVLPSALLEHLEERCTGLHAINAIEILLIIQGYYSDASIMPINVNILEDAQHKLQSTNQPLSDTTLLDTAIKAVFDSQ